MNLLSPLPGLIFSQRVPTAVAVGYYRALLRSFTEGCGQIKLQPLKILALNFI